MTDTTPPPPMVWPALSAVDAPRLLDFLREAFGFEETVVHRDGDQVGHAELAWPPGGGVMLSSAHRDDADHEPDWTFRPGTFAAYVVTTEPDALFARATAAGAQAVSAPQDTDYGSRQFTVRDPEGNKWTFGTYRGAPRGK